MRAVLFGLLAVILLIGGVGVFLFVVTCWAKWAMDIQNPFWSVALSPFAGIALAVLIVVFRMQWTKL